MSVCDKDRKKAATSLAKIIRLVKSKKQLGENLLCSIRGNEAGCKVVPKGSPFQRNLGLTLGYSSFTYRYAVPINVCEIYGLLQMFYILFIWTVHLCI